MKNPINGTGLSTQLMLLLAGFALVIALLLAGLLDSVLVFQSGRYEH